MAVPQLTRAQLAQIISDPRILDALEALFQQAQTLNPDLSLVNFVVTASDPTAPNAHVIGATGPIAVSAAPGAVTLSMTNSGVTAGGYSLCTITVDAKGRVTSAASASTTGTGAVVLAGGPALTGSATAQTLDVQTLLKGKGTTGAATPAAGYLGEYNIQTTPSATPVALTTGTDTNIAQVTLQPGDYDVRGSIFFIPTAATGWIRRSAALNTTSATRGAVDGNLSYFFEDSSGFLGTDVGRVAPLGTQRFGFTVATTVYLVARADFTGGAVAASGSIAWRRAS